MRYWILFVNFIEKKSEWSLDDYIISDISGSCSGSSREYHGNRGQTSHKEQWSERCRAKLVIKDAVDEEWLAGPRQELNFRLHQMRKIWKVQVLVLNETFAKKYRLVCAEQGAG